MPHSSASPCKPITIATYNMHKGMSALNRQVQLSRMAQALDSLRPDVLFLQEVQGEHLKRQQKLLDFPKAPHYDILGTPATPSSAPCRSTPATTSILPSTNWKNAAYCIAKSSRKTGLIR